MRVGGEGKNEWNESDAGAWDQPLDEEKSRIESSVGRERLARWSSLSSRSDSSSERSTMFLRSRMAPRRKE